MDIVNFLLKELWILEFMFVIFWTCLVVWWVIQDIIKQPTDTKQPEPTE